MRKLGVSRGRNFVEQISLFIRAKIWKKKFFLRTEVQLKEVVRSSERW